MKIKNIFLSLTATIALALTSSCSNIDPDDRLIYVKPAEVGRTVLIEAPNDSTKSWRHTAKTTLSWWEYTADRSDSKAQQRTSDS